MLSSETVSSSPSVVESTADKPSAHGDASDVDDGLRAALGILSEDQTLGRYELLAPIGRGGMAIVWAARLRGTHGFSKVVALKTMLPALSSDPRFEGMFLAEAEIAARIKHPNVCEILDLGEDRGIVYLVMEAIDGEPLSRLEDTCIALGRQVPCGVAARIVAQAARGLHAAHDLKSETGELCAVIHRDVSPQNILVTCDGLVKIVDFGVARAAERSDHTTASGFIKGKVAYLAPEQIESRAIDVRVDVFALGVVLHELLSGEHPFQGETDLSTLLSIASPDPAPRLPALDDAYPPKLRAIVERALEKEPAKRYPSMRELAIALEAFAAEVEKGEDEVSAFVTEMLGARRAERKRELREAARSADARRDRKTPAKTARAVTPAGAAASDASGASDASESVAGTTARPRGRRLAVIIVGVAGIGMGALGLRASQVAIRPAEANSAASSVASASSSPSPSPSPSSASPSSASSSAASSSSVRPATEPPPSSAAALPGASAPAASLVVRPPSAARPVTNVGRPAMPPAPGARSANPAPPGSAVKKNPLDGWD